MSSTSSKPPARGRPARNARRRPGDRLWARLVGATAAVGAGAALGYVAWLRPRLGDAAALTEAAAVLSYAQVVLGVVALVLAAVFGPYAVEQVVLGRQALEEDREERQRAAAAEERRVFGALYNEL